MLNQNIKKPVNIVKIQSKFECKKYNQKIGNTYILLAKPPRVILWYTISDFFFETVQRNEFIYFYRNDFPIFGALIGGTFRTMTHCVHRRYPKFLIFFEILLLCCLCKDISYNFTRLAMFYLKHLYSETLDVSMMNRD